MTPLSEQQKRLLFDYCIGLASEEQTAEAEALISSTKEASEIYSKLKTTLAPLDSAEIESCPDDLADGTIWRLNNLARSSRLGLRQLLAAEQSREVAVKSRFWRSVGGRLATAAVFMVVGSVLITTFRVTSNYARQKSWQQQCQMQLSSIFDGMGQYRSDHDGRMPAVATTTGAPWWKVGYRGRENHSNTRHIWLLVKGNYVSPADFVCPGKRQNEAIKFGPLQTRDYNDFPARRNVTYSFRIECNKSGEKDMSGQKVLMSDLNPLFERLPQNYSDPLILQLSKKLLTSNSINHARRGQNVLFGDGSIKFVKSRSVGLSQDDIFTLQGTNTYKGVEIPSSEADIFLAP